jgi:O-antigen/teichoic acid export membrane protein
VVGFVTLGGGMAFFAEPILRLWTGSPELAQASAPVLFGYGLANALLGVMLLPFMLQFAHGRLRLHVLGNLLLLALSVPALLLAVSRWGATGAGLALCVLNALFLLGWSPLVHRQFMPAQRWRWLLCDTLPVLGCILALLAGLAWLMPPALGLLPALLWIVVAMGLAGLGGALAGSQSRGFILQQLQLRGRKR